MGRTKKPSNLKVLHGTDRADRRNDNEPKPEGFTDIPQPPHWLDYYAKKEWERNAPFLVRAGLLTYADVSMYATYCQTYARVIRAEKAIMEEGMYFTTPNGHIQKRPEVTIARDEKQLLAKYASRLGLDPASRSGISVDMSERPKTAEEILDGTSRD